MPYVNIKITKEKEAVSAEQKRALIAGVTKLLGDTLKRDVSRTVVVIEEVSTDDYGFGGKSITELRSKQGK
ncbi:tautomerase family protein [Campylobacter showae]|jgi:4-oxalocrotonate tautomerase family enzyme|uniref:tautomerase family protein n=1 Tax=Campylobacter showae TaxID=204 RepID=UPI000F07552F|nr:4-oxalocrotonate tautomerase family protein [Campylobacter showae]